MFLIYILFGAIVGGLDYSLRLTSCDYFDNSIGYSVLLGIFWPVTFGPVCAKWYVYYKRLRK